MPNSKILIENSRFYPTPPAFGATVVVTQLECHQDLWHQKTRLPGLLCGVVCMIMFSRFGAVVQQSFVENSTGYQFVNVSSSSSVSSLVKSSTQVDYTGLPCLRHQSSTAITVAAFKFCSTPASTVRSFKLLQELIFHCRSCSVESAAILNSQHCYFDCF